ncbi:hypothetical protein F5Y08DRAFT_111441 [Xylaria arbuscula]|nr:hypothetical protein F5Y08DRAFT_111441 [Xylaria arbuscula]
MNVLSWLEGIAHQIPTESSPSQLPKTRKRKRQQMPTPTQSANADTTPNKRQRPDEQDDTDFDRTPRGRSSKSWSDVSSCSSRASRTSPTKRLAKLEVAENPVLVKQISRKDPSMPKELKSMLEQLDGFQNRTGIVPMYLATEIHDRAKFDDDFYNFMPFTFGDDTVYPSQSNPPLSLRQILKVFESAKECLNEDHAEATWNTLVHWPVFELALGSIGDVSELARANDSLTKKGSAEDGADQQGHEQQSQEPQHQKSHVKAQVYVRGMPCSAARLIGRHHGSKMVDYCIFVEPGGRDCAKIDELREGQPYINHTDYHALRRRPIVLSAESKKPGEGFRNAQLQLSVWQAAQWSSLLRLAADGSEGMSTMIPFLPALIIQGHDWYFAATTRSDDNTVLWIKQPVGSTESVLGIFQVIRGLRHIASWTRETYWPWYKQSVLHLVENKS